MTASTFIGDLQGNAATATKLKTPRTIWGQSFDGSGNVNGDIALPSDKRIYIKGAWDYGHVIRHYNNDDLDGFGVSMGFCVKSYIDDINPIFLIRNGGNSYFNVNGNVGIGTTTPGYKLDVNGNMRVTSDIYADATVGTSNFASHTTGWNVSAQGAADFRNIYADELRVQAFTADISQALAGSDYLTKSVSKLSANFVVPAVNSTVRIIVDDIEGMPVTQCFANGDYIRFRAFNRTSGLTIANVWGTVILDTTFGTNGFSNGTQAYTFTCKATSGAGLTVFKGSEVLDYGTSGSGMIARTTLDAQGSPYEQIATWQGDPSNGNNYTVHARLGNLGGIANCNGYGVYTDNGFFTGNVVIGDLTKNNNFLSFDGVNGLQIKLGGADVATATDISGAIATASSDATTKANAAYSNAVSYTNSQITATNNSITASVNAIQIGGANILRNTRNWTTTDYWYDNGGGISIDSSITYLGQPTLKTTGLQGITGSWYRVEENTYYTYSAMLYVSSEITIGGNSPLHKWVSTIYDCTHNEQNQTTNISSIPAKTWTLASVTFLVPSGSTYFKPFFFGWDSGVQLNVAYIKCEKGNKATDWTPAPEDIDANITNAQNDAISTAASNAAALYVTQSAYSSQVTILQNSINAKVSQTDFNALGTRVGTAESNITQNATDIGLKVSKDGVIGAINLTSEAATIQASKINLVGAVTIASLDSTVTAQALGGATPTDVSTAVNNIQIGGRNYVLNSSTDIVIPTRTSEQNWTQAVFSVSSIVVNDNNKKTYTLSFDAYGGTHVFRDIVLGYAQSGGDAWALRLYEEYFTKTLNIDSSYHYTITFTVDRPNGQTFGVSQRFIAEGDTTGGIIRHLNIEDGTKETSWKPAPEDVDSSISTAQNAAQTYATTNCVQVGLSNAPDAIKNQVLAAAHGNFSYIDGSSIYTGTLNANQVTAGYISSDRIAANTITSDKVNMSEFTASSGFVDSFNANVVATKRLNVAKIVADGIAAQTIDAQSATISNLNVVNATVSGYFHAEYSAGAFVRMG